MSDINKVILVGRLGADGVLKDVGNTSVLNFTVATSKSWDKDGQRQEKTEWHRCALWGKRAQILAQYVTKGRQVFIEGEIQSNSWEGKNGEKRESKDIMVSDIQLLGGPAKVGAQDDFGGI
jgi:single-strand DNA-binding protein